MFIILGPEPPRRVRLISGNSGYKQPIFRKGIFRPYVTILNKAVHSMASQMIRTNILAAPWECSGGNDPCSLIFCSMALKVL